MTTVSKMIFDGNITLEIKDNRNNHESVFTVTPNDPLTESRVMNLARAAQLCSLPDMDDLDPSRQADILNKFVSFLIDSGNAKDLVTSITKSHYFEEWFDKYRVCEGWMKLSDCNEDIETDIIGEKEDDNIHYKMGFNADKNIFEIKF